MCIYSFSIPNDYMSIYFLIISFGEIEYNRPYKERM